MAVQFRFEVRIYLCSCNMTDERRISTIIYLLLEPSNCENLYPAFCILAAVKYLYFFSGSVKLLPVQSIWKPLYHIWIKLQKNACCFKHFWSSMWYNSSQFLYIKAKSVQYLNIRDLSPRVCIFYSLSVLLVHSWFLFFLIS